MKRLLIAALLLLVLALPAGAATVKIGIVADPHVPMAGALTALQGARDWAVDTGEADFVLVLGDMINGASGVDYITAVLDAIAGNEGGQTPKPYAVVLGNHDVVKDVSDRAGWIVALAAAGGSDQTSFNQRISAGTKTDVIVLDGNYELAGGVYTHKENITTITNTLNYVHPDDIGWLDTALAAAEAEGHWVILAIHQPLNRIGVGGINNLVDVLAVVDEYSCVLAILSGHIHANVVSCHMTSRNAYNGQPAGRPIRWLTLRDIGAAPDARQHAGVLAVDEDTGYLTMVGRTGIEQNYDISSWDTLVWSKTGAASNISVAASWATSHSPVAKDLFVVTDDTTNGGVAVVQDISAGRDRQRLTVPASDPGDIFKIQYQGFKTAALAWDITAANMQIAVRALNPELTSSTVSLAGGVYTVLTKQSRDLLVFPPGKANGNFDCDLGTLAVTAESGIWLQPTEGGSAAITLTCVGQPGSTGVNIISVGAGATVVLGTLATNGFTTSYVRCDGTISGPGKIRLILGSPGGGFGCWEGTGTFTGAQVEYYVIAASAFSDWTVTNQRPMNLGSAILTMYHVKAAGGLKQKAALTCGPLVMAGNLAEFRLAVQPNGGAGLTCTSLTYGVSGQAYPGELLLGAGVHIIADATGMVGNAASHALTLGGRVELGGNVTLAGITTDFGDAKIDATAAITFDGTNATGTTSGNCIITGRGGLVTFTAMQTNFTGRPILARRFTTDAGSVAAVQPAAPHWLTGLR